MTRTLLASALVACVLVSRPAAQDTHSGSATGSDTTTGGLGIRGAGAAGGDANARAAPAREAARKGEAVVMGSIDKNGIRKVVQDHADEIRGC